MEVRAVDVPGVRATPDDLLTVAQAADLVGVQTGTLHTHIQRDRAAAGGSRSASIA